MSEEIRVSHAAGHNLIPPDTPKQAIEKNEVDIENIGPIEHLTLTAEPGKITVLTGPNGAGKTQALNAVDSLVSGKTRLSNRDGTISGTARGFGVQIKVGRGGSNRRSGDLEIESVEDRLNIAHLVDPGLKDPVASDARRIKALVTLTGVEAKPELFYDLAGGKERFAELVKPASIDQADVVAMASAIKRDFELSSRKEADVAENLERDIRARAEANEGINIEAPHDAYLLQDALEMSLSEMAAEKQRATDAFEALEAASAARLRIEESKSEYDGPTVDTAQNSLAALINEVIAQKQEIDAIQKKLNDAENVMIAIENRRELARNNLLRAQEHATLTAKWEADVKAAENVELTSDVKILSLTDCVADCRKAIETGVRVRDALVRRREAWMLDDRKIIANRNAESLRDAARGTEDVLSRLVAEMGGPFKVNSEFRLVVQHPMRGEIYFAELSTGEGCILALDVVIEAFVRAGQHGLLAIPQEMWEGLDADNRRLIAKHIEGTDLAVITAEVSRKENADSEIGVATFE